MNLLQFNDVIINSKMVLPEELLDIIFSFLPVQYMLYLSKEYYNRAKTIFIKYSVNKIVKWYKSIKLKKEFIYDCSNINEIIRFLIVKEKRRKYSLYLPERIFNYFMLRDGLNPLCYNFRYDIKHRDRTIRFSIDESKKLCSGIVKVVDFRNFYTYDKMFNYKNYKC